MAKTITEIMLPNAWRPNHRWMLHPGRYLVPRDMDGHMARRAIREAGAIDMTPPATQPAPAIDTDSTAAEGDGEAAPSGAAPAAAAIEPKKMYRRRKRSAPETKDLGPADDPQ
jgi:hypothetical protein